MFFAAWNTWDLALLAAAAYVAVVTLVRLMLRHRDQLAADLQRQVDAERQRLEAEQRKAEKERQRREIQEAWERQRRNNAA